MPAGAPPPPAPLVPAGPGTALHAAHTAAMAQQYSDLAEMTGGFIHDMKNHLGTVLLNLQLLGEDFETPQTHKDRRTLDRITLMTGECQRLVDLSNDFLRFARVAEMHPEATPLDAVVSRMIDFLGPTAREQKITVNWYPAADLPPVLVDPEMFERVLLNLMMNAEDAMPDGGTLTLQARPADGFVELDVIDTGTGIPADVLPQLFKPFLTTKPDGNGLGLATARKIIVAHGGAITVQTAPGRGTKFTLRLPVAP